MKWEISIRRDWCKKCGICSHFCPKGALEADEFGAPVAAHPEQCVGCGMCEYRCPDFAIQIIKKGA